MIASMVITCPKDEIPEDENPDEHPDEHIVKTSPLPLIYYQNVMLYGKLTCTKLYSR